MILSGDYLIDDFLSGNTSFIRGNSFEDTIESVERFIIHEAGQPLGVMVIEAPDELRSDVDKLSEKYSTLRANRRTNHFVSKSLINGFITDIKLLYSKLVNYDAGDFFKNDTNQLLTIVNYFDVFSPKLTPFSGLFDNYTRNIIPFNENNAVRITNSSLCDYDLKVDTSKFNFLLLNLGKNSINAIESRYKSLNGLIDVSVKKEGDFFVLRHRDNGCGMSNELLAKLFKTSFSTNADSNLHGLGTLIIKDIVESHGGFIKAKSGLNAGTEIIVYLPNCL
ncbi:MAG TPA: ATP-binding protein [Candidatus Nanoarchaeia archaeon]|nr:ATP-binding protein [Candidatus Nanoarchaeia archaeon]